MAPQTKTSGAVALEGLRVGVGKREAVNGFVARFRLMQSFNFWASLSAGCGYSSGQFRVGPHHARCGSKNKRAGHGPPSSRGRTDLPGGVNGPVVRV
jgi:hypothetical protein